MKENQDALYKYKNSQYTIFKGFYNQLSCSNLGIPILLLILDVTNYGRGREKSTN
jgi:hypothetical protein